jgi:hypothetical protein
LVFIFDDGTGSTTVCDELQDQTNFMKTAPKIFVLAAGLALSTHALFAQAAAPDAATQAAELAKKLSNPVAALISVPFQFNADFGIGANGGTRYLTNIQPVVPIELNPEWNLISRTILPVIAQNDVVGTGRESGIGDVLQSVFFSPKAPTAGGVIWGAGPVLLLPTASEDVLGGGKWAAGPTVLLLKQEHGWTKGILVNHLWSFAGDDARGSINATYLQPFISYGGIKPGFTIGGAFEATYDWNHDQWTIPFVPNISQVMKVGGQLVSVSAGVKLYLEKPAGGPDWGLRFGVTLLFPK